MKANRRNRFTHSALTHLACGITSLVLGVRAHAGVISVPSFEWDLEFTSMDFNATALLPLGPGWSPILTNIHIGESPTHASMGKIFAFRNPNLPPQPNSPPIQGEELFVQSFFDVFFDISFTDVDPGSNFGGSQVDGLSLNYPDNGPAHMQNFYLAKADLSLPNFGLFPPPEAAPAIGWFTIEIPLGADLNGNGETDKMKFTLAALTAANENRTFITLPDGMVVNTFDTILDLSGAVVDAHEDPPFSVTLTGPTTATTRLVGTTGVPDGGSTLLMLSSSLTGLAGMFMLRKRNSR